MNTARVLPQPVASEPCLRLDQDAWLRHVLHVHFHPRDGAPYWLERQRLLGLDVLEEVRRVEDLPLLGPMPEADLAERPLEDFLPRPILDRRRSWVVVETGGSLGPPKTTLYLERELREAFVDPFTDLATACRFPEGRNWLFVGPTGPHVIGRAARENARALGSPEPFTVDLDPRWAKRLAPGTMARARYLQHVVEQAARILRTQDIGVLFTTPAILSELARSLEPSIRHRIEGIFYGGMPIEPPDYLSFRRAFPAAVHLAGYGNTLVGLALQTAPSVDGSFEYFHPGIRLHVRLVDTENAPADGIGRDVPPGRRGRVVVSRLDESFLIPNLLERDEAQALPAPMRGGAHPLVNPGLRDPRPLEEIRGVRAAVGIY